MKKSKNILAQFTFLIALLFSSQSLFAQGGMGGPGGGGGMGGPGGGGMGGPGGSSSSGEMISSENMLTSTGLFMIEYDEAIKKIKVKKREHAKREAVESLFETYNTKYNEISIAYSTQIESILKEEERSSTRGGSNSMQGGQQRGNMGQDPMSGKISAMKQITEVAKPMHDALNESLGEILSEKQLKRWNKYYTKLCDKNYVGQVESKSNSRGGGMGGPGGMSGGGMGR